MSTRTNNDVTLPHATADDVSKLLAAYASNLEQHAKRTRSAAVRNQVQRDAEQCRNVANLIVESLFTWTSAPHAGRLDSAACVSYTCAMTRDSERTHNGNDT